MHFSYFHYYCGSDELRVFCLIIIFKMMSCRLVVFTNSKMTLVVSFF